MNTKLLVASTKAVTTVKSKLARLAMLVLFMAVLGACGGGESNEFDGDSGDPGKPEQSVEENGEPGIAPNDGSVSPPSTQGTVIPSPAVNAAALYMKNSVPPVTVKTARVVSRVASSISAMSVEASKAYIPPFSTRCRWATRPVAGPNAARRWPPTFLTIL